MLKSFYKISFKLSFDWNSRLEMKKINILITLMAVSLMALLAFQWYWIQNALHVKTEAFDRKVTDVLNSTVQKIEKQEVIYVARRNLLEKETRNLINIAQVGNEFSPINQKEVKSEEDFNSNITSDPLKSKMAENGPKIENNTTFKNDILKLRKQPFSESESQYLRQNLNEEIRSIERFQQHSIQIKKNQDNINEINTFFDNEINIVLEDPGSVFLYEFNDIKQQLEFPKNRQNIESSNKIAMAEKIRKGKAAIVKDVFTDFINGKRNINERLGSLMLDTLLKDEFRSNGISIPFDYAVKDNGCVVFASINENAPSENLQKAYRVKLFPNDTYQQEQYLSVYFPDKESFIFGNMWSILGSSLLLVCMVGGVFFYSVNTMLSQKKLSNIKTDFINNMTHELKTPVATIGLALEVIRDETIVKTPEKTNRYLNIIHDENQRLGQQVEKVLNIAQLEKGDIKLFFEDLDAHKVISDSLHNLTVQIEKFGVTVVQNFAANNHQVHADNLHFTNIVVNLLDNAIKYSTEKPEIEISTENQNGEFVLKIKDNGIGIAKDQLSKIFDRFYRVPKGNLHDVKGFGLGLSYVKDMLKLHSGRIEAKSTPNEGSEFKIYLPLKNNIT